MILNEAGEAYLRHRRLERHLSPNSPTAYRQDVLCGRPTLHSGQGSLRRLGWAARR